MTKDGLYTIGESTTLESNKSQYILDQPHGVPPVSVAFDHTTLKEEGSCGYSSIKTVRSIVIFQAKRSVCDGSFFTRMRGNKMLVRVFSISREPGTGDNV